MTVVVARLVGPRDFGSVAYALAIWTTAMGVTRAVFVQPYIVRVAAASESERRTTTEAAAGTVLATGLILGAGVIAVAVGIGVGTVSGQVLFSLGILLGPLLLQDFWRFAAFASQRASAAFVNDLVWAAAQTTSFAMLWRAGSLSAPTAVLSWGASAAIAGVGGIYQFDVMPKLQEAKRWAAEAIGVGRWFGASTLVFMIGTQVVLIVLGVVGGRAAVGEYRSVMTLLGPIQLLTIAGESVRLPSAARALTLRGPRHLVRTSIWYSAAMTTAAAAYGVVLAVGGAGLLRAAFGRAYEGGHPYIAPVTIVFALGMCASGAEIALRARREGRTLFAVQFTMSVARVGLVFVLGLRVGVVGAVWGAAAYALMNALVLWICLLRKTPSSQVTSRDGVLPERSPSSGIAEAATVSTS